MKFFFSALALAFVMYMLVHQPGADKPASKAPPVTRNVAAAPAAQPCPDVVQFGQTNAVVTRAQQALARNSQPVRVDGEFGGSTKAAVEAFQRQRKISPTGRVDEVTWRALGECR